MKENYEALRREKFDLEQELRRARNHQELDADALMRGYWQEEVDRIQAELREVKRQLEPYYDF